MTINDKRKLRVTILLVLCSFLAAHLCFWILPNIFEIWNSQAVDQLFVFRSSSEKLRPAYNNTVAHVDLNNTSIKRLENLYLNRSHFAQVTRNLTSMQVSAQVYDFIFAARLDESDDRALIRATQEAGNVYFGLAFELWQEDQLLKRRGTMRVQFKGMDQPVTLYDVVGMGGEYQVALPEKEARPLIKVDPPIHIACLSVVGKTVSETSISGYITHFRGSAADVSIEKPLEVGSNLKILFVQEEASALSEVYAKVMSVEPFHPKSSNFKARLEFTWLPEDAKAFIHALANQ